MDIIDYHDARPIYEQISSWYKSLILRGVMEPDEQMPSVRSLAMDLSTNPNTVQKAYAELERQGYIYTVRGNGNFVSRTDKLLEDKKHELAQRIAELIGEADELGFDRDEMIRLVRNITREGHRG